MKAKKGPSVFAEDVVVIGAIWSEGQVEIFGRVEGDVRVGSLTIGKDASVTGEVVAENLVVRGHIEGLVRAHSVQLVSTASVQGDIVQSKLTIQNGAEFNGHCRHEAGRISDHESVHKPVIAPKGFADELDMPPLPPLSVMSDGEPDMGVPPIAEAAQPANSEPTGGSGAAVGKARKPQGRSAQARLANTRSVETPPPASELNGSKPPRGEFGEGS